jgi:AcrR family transcriptional regulator
MHKPRVDSPIPAQQARSRETQESLLVAAEHVFADVGISQATVAQICERAGVAVGTFYGRFPDKDALLVFWYERFFRRGRIAFDRAFSDAMWEGRAPTDIVRGWVQARVLHYRRNRKLFKALLVHVRGRPNPAFQPFAGLLLLPTLQRLSHLLLKGTVAVRHGEPAIALRMAVIMTESSIQTMVLFHEPSGDDVALTDDVLVEQLADAMSAYLRISA